MALERLRAFRACGCPSSRSACLWIKVDNGGGLAGAFGGDGQVKRQGGFSSPALLAQNCYGMHKPPCLIAALLATLRMRQSNLPFCQQLPEMESPCQRDAELPHLRIALLP